MKKGKLIVQPMGGLANRMRVIGVLYELAKRAGASLCVLWVNNAELGAKWIDLFDYPNDFYIEELTPKDGRYMHGYLSKNWYNNINSYLWAYIHGYRWYPSNMVESMNCDTSEEGLEHLYSTWISQLQKGNTLFISTGDYLGNNYDISAIFRPKHELQEKIDAFSLPDQNIYGIHIRRSDNTWAIDNSPIALFETEIEQILSSESDARFYLASDDKEIILHLRNKYGEHIIVRDKTFGRGSVEGMQDALIDMWILSGTKKIFGSYYSSFSEMASAIGSINLMIVKK